MRQQYNILIGFPYGGSPCMSFETARSLYRATNGIHRCGILGANGSWGNFNQILAKALNLAAKGEITHLAFLHADIAPEEFWVDILADELDRLDADMISVACPIKDTRGVTSCGIGNPRDRWHPLRRVTMEELWNKLPATWNAADFGYPDYPLLHNDGCWLADLRKPVWSMTNAAGELVAFFDFPRRVIRKDGEFVAEGESEDWFWSRRLHELGAKTYVTRKVALQHTGPYDFPNTGPWGTEQQDEGTRERWDREDPTLLHLDPKCRTVIEDESGNAVGCIVG